MTEREKDVLKLIAQEFSSQEIATQLFISVNTVETHRKNLLSKLHAKNIAGLVKFAIQTGLVS
ncbi:MAG: response regulator transcription factor [Bacteroidetes bacterium]|nr:response regulator transcription factor [Bacteroidota bacterium]